MLGSLHSSRKKDPFDVQNWRPVSILPITSKLFERTLEEQFSYHFEKKNQSIPFRKGISCQSVLLAVTEEWQRALDGNEYVAAILMDLSKTFRIRIVYWWNDETTITRLWLSSTEPDKRQAHCLWSVYRCSRFDKWLFVQSKTMC